MSTKSLVVHGVPQGSILGPILFSIFVNDISEYVNDSVLIQYADDTQFIHSGNNNNLDQLISRAKSTLSNAKTYFLNSGHMLNCKKTQSIFSGTRQLLSAIPDDMTINFDGSNIPVCKNVKILGVHFDRHMTFDTHIHQLTKKVTGILMFINRVKDLFDKDTRLIVIHTLVSSVINYGLKIWRSTKETLMQQLLKLQIFAAKVTVGGYKRHDHATPVIK